MERRKCRDCQIEKDIDQFVKNHVFKDGIDTLCKACNHKRVKQWRKDNPDGRKNENKKAKLKTKHKDLKYSFGLTLDQFFEMVARQDNKCAICGKPESRNQMLAVDHDHSSGKIRDLLCSSCNTGLGLFKEDISTMANAIIYVTKWNSNANY